MLGNPDLQKLRLSPCQLNFTWKGGGETNDMWGWEASPPQGTKKKYFFAFFNRNCFYIILFILFTGTVSRDFRLLVFFMNQFPQAPEYTITAISNFFENLRRYSRLKCHRCRWHRWHMEKIFKLKNAYNFFFTPVGSKVNIYINFPSSSL